MVRSAGTRTKIPQSPYTTLGMAASNPMRKATGWRTDLGRELGEVDRHAERERHRYQESDQRGEQGPENQRERAELFRHRVPGARGDEVEAEPACRKPRSAPQLVDQKCQKDGDEHSGEREDQLEDPVAVIGSLERDRSEGGDFLGLLDRGHVMSVERALVGRRHGQVTARSRRDYFWERRCCSSSITGTGSGA